MEARNYDVNKVTVSFLGVPLTGFSEGSKVKVERNVDAYTLKVGCDGDSCRSKSQNHSGRITVRLSAGSPSNDALAGAAVLDENSGMGAGELGVVDLNGTMLAHAGKAWVVKQPAADFEKEVGEREWVFETGDLELYVGGNYTT